MVKYKIYVSDKQDNSKSENVVESRKNTSLKTIVLKGIEKHVEEFAADPLEFMREVKYLFRESENHVDFIEDLNNELDLLISIGDLNNNTYRHKETEEQTTSYEVGLQSYENAWRSQLNEVDGEQNFNKYIPDKDIIIEHGNELMANDVDSSNEEWEIIQ